MKKQISAHINTIQLVEMKKIYTISVNDINNLNYLKGKIYQRSLEVGNLFNIIQFLTIRDMK